MKKKMAHSFDFFFKTIFILFVWQTVEQEIIFLGKMQCFVSYKHTRAHTRSLSQPIIP